MTNQYTISIYLAGGLGNRLFQVAIMYGISRKHNRKYFLNLIETNIHSNIDYITTIFKNFNYENIINNDNIHTYSIIRESSYSTYELINNISNNILIINCPQNVQYFNDYYNEIINLLNFDYINNKYKVDINAYFIHIRRGDYLTSELHKDICNDNYFKLAIYYIRSIDSTAQFYVFSDDIEYCKSLDYLKNEYFIKDLDELTTLYLMSKCIKGGICPNSTFSWWGSYLNTNKEKIVIMPKKWLNDGICDIYYENCIILDNGLVYKYINNTLIDLQLNLNINIKQNENNCIPCNLLNNDDYIIGLYSIFIGDYTIYYEDYIQNMVKYFMPKYKKIFYIVTDDKNLKTYNQNIQFYYTEKIGYPYETLYRYKYFLQFTNIEADIIYFLQSNARCYTYINDDILPDLSGYIFTLHAWQMQLSYHNYTYDKNINSTAFIDITQNKQYVYIGGRFHGGLKNKFIEMYKLLDNNISIDEQNDYIALWHDESHLNKFVNDNLSCNAKLLNIFYHIPEEFVDNINEQNKQEIKIIYLNKEKNDNVRNYKPENPISGKIIINKYNKLFIKNYMLEKYNIKFKQLLDELGTPQFTCELVRQKILTKNIYEAAELIDISIYIFNNIKDYLIKYYILTTYLKDFNGIIKFLKNNANKDIPSYLTLSYLDDLVEYSTMVNVEPDKVILEPVHEYRYFCYRYRHKILEMPLPELHLNLPKEAVLIESRILPHIMVIIRNAILKLGNTWSFTILCTANNYEYMKDKCSNLNIKIIKLDNIDKINSKIYIEIQTSNNILDLIIGEKILYYNEDTFIFKSNINDFMEYDYIGAPWPQFNNEKYCGGNGGFVLRTKSIMKQIINTISINDTEYTGEDVYFYGLMKKLNIGKIADFITSVCFSSECYVTPYSLGMHSFFLYTPYWKEYMYNYLI